MRSLRVARRTYRRRRGWSCQQTATTRTLCALSMQFTFTCVRVPMTQWDAAVRKSTLPSQAHIQRQRMNAWANGSQRRMHTLAAAFGVLLLTCGLVRAQAPGLGSSAELVDPKAFRVCADPRNL